MPVPADRETLRLYVAFLARTLSPSSISGYLNVVRLIHLEGGFVNPLSGNWEISTLQKGIARLNGSPAKQKQPITVSILLDLYRNLTDCPLDKAFWLACLIAFLVFLRKSTLIPSRDLLLAGKFIARNDVVDVTLTLFALKSRHSKTNQFGQRVLMLPILRVLITVYVRFGH